MVSYITIGNIWMSQMMPSELSWYRNMIVKNIQLYYYTHIYRHPMKIDITEQEAYDIYYAVTKWKTIYWDLTLLSEMTKSF